MGFVLIVDFGGQYAHLIARRIRELGVYSELLSASSDLETILDFAGRSQGVVLSGGPLSVTEGRHDEIAKSLLRLGKPLLGICYGHQLLAKVLGGSVGRSPAPEFGPTKVELSPDELFEGIPAKVTVWMSHNDAVLEAPPGAKVLARTRGSPVAAMRYGAHWSVQWHPEVSHTQYGLQMYDNWLRAIGARRDWRPENMIEELTEMVRREIGGSLAVSAVSGGVDSTVASLIVKRAIGERLVPILIDHGLHPAGEPELSIALLENVGLKPLVIKAEEEFFSALKGIREPEEKRRAFGRLYARLLEDQAERLGAEFLVQGTIYPDVIESGGRVGASVIKTHHNVAGMPKQLRFKVVEPLKWFYKDEVRAIGRKLGVPEEILRRQPVPGPALAVRVEGEVTRERVELVRRADAIVREEIEGAGIGGLWQYFAVLTSSKATGVKGDERAYGHVIAIRAVESVDAMTASIARLPWEVLERIAARITGEVPGVTRVVYDITSKPPATVEWE
ncbi:MAG: glutamine-hydrolyzing GMP synthase [Acidilobaceae archaeon]|nr:glutamine-hydrolyzing GMP synthase [Acidilobaceae archaeon]MCX8165866.1 glutamine-hydrolyzing GMP synthase [Acidilobaceae archaeon]MDW7974874.1 glutamine-hydrolyzing GMP synthase [Sulfolobales archaeon]